MQITSSPCVSICHIDPTTGYCLGCGRTTHEIGRWVMMSEPERLALMATLPDRFTRHPELVAARIAHTTRERTGRRRRF